MSGFTRHWTLTSLSEVSELVSVAEISLPGNTTLPSHQNLPLDYPEKKDISLNYFSNPSLQKTNYSYNCWHWSPLFVKYKKSWMHPMKGSTFTMATHPSNRWTGVAGMKYKTLLSFEVLLKIWQRDQVDQHFGISVAASIFQDNTDLNEHSCKSISCLPGRFEFWGVSTSRKHHWIHFLLLLLFCKHSFNLKAKFLIPEHSAYATILNKKDQLVFISYHACSTRSQLSLQPWKPFCSQRATETTLVCLFSSRHLYSTKKRKWGRWIKIKNVVTFPQILKKKKVLNHACSEKETRNLIYLWNVSQ